MKLLIIVCCLAALVLTACSSEQPIDSLAGERNAALAKQLYRHFNDHNWKAMAALYADTAEFKDPSLGSGIVKQTREQIETKYAELESVYPDIRDEIVRIYPSGKEHVIVEFISSGSSSAGEQWTLPICTIFEMKNGLITKDFTYYDNR
jgi:predicted SnoaL-like aldol condensation-catalyzing enzyme